MLRSNFYKTVLVLTAFYLPVSSVLAQNFKKDFTSTQEAYSKLDRFYCEVGINIYDSYKAQNPSEKIASVIKKQKNNFWYSMGKTTIIVNDNCILYISDENKQITYTIRDKKDELSIPNQNAAAMIDT